MFKMTSVSLYRKTLQGFSDLLNHVYSGVANSIIGGGDNIHIFVFIGHKNNRFQRKLVMQNTNI